MTRSMSLTATPLSLASTRNVSMSATAGILAGPASSTLSTASAAKSWTIARPIEGMPAWSTENPSWSA